MRALLTDIVHSLLSIPLYLVLVLVWITARAYMNRARGTALWRWRHGIAVLCGGVYAVSITATANSLLAYIEGQWPVPTLNAVRATASKKDGDSPQILALTGGWFRKTEAGYVVVMGGASWERTVCAVDLHQQVGGKLMFTGAPLPDGSDSVAQRMAHIANRMGVPAERIAVETRSLNTRENMLFSLQEFGLQERGPVVLLTSAIHMPRSVAAARGVGLNVLPYPCDFRADKTLTWRHFIPSNEAPVALEEVLHEGFGLVMYWMRGWL